MRKNGFTLIELLAVIVILAIIALIATPIILGIINDVREKANERSLELYALAVRNGIVTHRLMTGEEVLPGRYTNETLPFEVEAEGNIECTSIIISEDKTVSLDRCKVNDEEKKYNYGEIEEVKICQLTDEDKNGKYSVGDVVTCIFEESTEQFYVIENEDTDETKKEISMLAKYNLYVGNRVEWTVDYPSGASGYIKEPLENSTGIQNELATADSSGSFSYGTVAFSDSSYWVDENDNLLDKYGSSFPAFVYDENSNLYQYVNAYEKYLKTNGVSSASATLISYEQIKALGCNNEGWQDCAYAPKWVYSTAYWIGSAYGKYQYLSGQHMMAINLRGVVEELCSYSDELSRGVRPVVTISISDLG